MKRLLMVFLIGLMVFKAHGQPSVDVGIFGGAGAYLGDMTETEWQKSINPAYGAFLRYNFNPRYALRLNIYNGTIGATGQFDSKGTINETAFKDIFIEPLSLPQTFEKNVLDASIQFEFNYFKYIVGDKPTPYSTYLFAGVGMQSYKYLETNGIVGEGGYGYVEYSEVTPMIPFGLGFKFNLSKRIGLGIETGFRKTFSDKLDNLDDPLSYENANGTEVTQVKYTDQYHNNDWTVYSGIHLVYKLFYGNKEWTLRTPKKHILDWGIENDVKKR